DNTAESVSSGSRCARHSLPPLRRRDRPVAEAMRTVRLPSDKAEHSGAVARPSADAPKDNAACVRTRKSSDCLRSCIFFSISADEPCATATFENRSKKATARHRVMWSIRIENIIVGKKGECVCGEFELQRPAAWRWVLLCIRNALFFLPMSPTALERFLTSRLGQGDLHGPPRRHDSMHNVRRTLSRIVIFFSTTFTSSLAIAQVQEIQIQGRLTINAVLNDLESGRIVTGQL